MAAERTTPRSSALAVLRDTSGGRRATQRERYQRIIDASMELASEGGYEAVQMRTVAERAEVALGTVYRYFPSKNHILVVAMLVVFDDMQHRFAHATIPGDTPSERIMFVLRKNTAVLERDPKRYEALVRAFMFADASAAAELDAFVDVINAMFAKAIGVENASEDQLNAAHVVGDVWMSSLVSWVAGRQSTEDVISHLGLTVSLVFRNLGG